MTSAIGRAPGPELHLLPMGAAIQRMVVTGGDGVRRDVAIGLLDGDAVRASPDYVGPIVGRYANRIAHGRFLLDDTPIRVTTNDRGHHLHGGPDGFHTRVWEVVEHAADVVEFALTSPDGDAGYPGEVAVRARYEVADAAVALTITATTDAATVVNLTSHVYLNLAGGGSIDAHLLSIPADRYTPVDDTGIPVGDHAPVTGTPFDLRTPTVLRDVLRADHPQIRTTRGLDHNYVVDGAVDAAGLRTMAVLDEPTSRTRLRLRSNQPGVQVYTGNGFDGSALDRTGRMIRQGDAIALEPQLHPDTPHHPAGPDWPTAVLRPGETYRHHMVWQFSALP